MGLSYDHTAIERKWQARWEKDGQNIAHDKGEENFYTLVEFPYPSGDLHIGHWYAYSVPDMYARLKRMQGKNVLFPFGYDAFGLPAENAAIKRNINPAEWIAESVAKMRAQMKTTGISFDWSREINTSHPSYMRWTQWLFLKLYERGLAYRGTAAANWCPTDQTVLANEQVIDGMCERCGSEVVQKEMEQWFFRITDYAERLLADLEPLAWPESIKEAQRNWIGKSVGAELAFPVAGHGIKRFLILHGRASTPETGFIPWLKRSLESKGYTVQVPQLPHADEPDDDEQAAFVRNEYTIDHETAIIGHSFGGNVALRLLERGEHPARVLLVGTPSTGAFKDGKERPSVSAAAKRGYDFQAVAASCDDIELLYDTHDRIIPTEDGAYLSKRIGAPVSFVKAFTSHFLGSIESDVLLRALPAVRVFTTRPDTLFGATYIVLAPEHPHIAQWLERGAIKNADAVTKYVHATAKKSALSRQKQEKQKTGVHIEGVHVLHPSTREEMPIYIADYVLSGYGSGAIMAVPAHDERDYEFATSFSLPVRRVVEGGEVPYTGTGNLIDSDSFSGMHNEEAKLKITEAVHGVPKTTYKLRDWLVSRQRYWGAPIPIVYDPDGIAHPIPDEHLPWLLPIDADIKPKGTSPLGSSKELTERVERIFGKGWKPETDTMDGFVDNSWYFLRYLDPSNDKEFSSLDAQRRWMPIKRYSGGAEHTTVHVLYSRFFVKALMDLGLATVSEPYEVRLNRGLILAEDGRKMSKRWGNVVNPDEQVERVGADAVRMYLGFIGPYNEVGSFPWSTNGLVGVRKFLERVYALKDSVTDRPIPNDLNVLLQQSIKKVGDDLENMKVNTSISQLMILSNSFAEHSPVPRQAYETFLKLLAPFAPHLAEEIWEYLGHTTSIHVEHWPAYDGKSLQSEFVTIAVQTGGKTKGTITVPRGSSKEEVIEAVRTDKKLNVLAAKLEIQVIYVADRVINFIR